MPPEINEHDITAMIGRLIWNQTQDRREDLIQAAWLAVLQAAAAYDEHPEWGSWWGTATRVARWSVLTSLGRKRHGGLAGEENLPERHKQLESVHMDVETLLARLPEQDHEIILMRFRDGLSSKEIGAKIGMTGEAVRLRIRKSLKHMRF